jgi:hypothetical protein
MTKYNPSSGFRPNLSRLDAATLRRLYDAWIARQVAV